MTLVLLASSSPRRTELLASAGLTHTVVEPPPDRAVPDGTPPDSAVRLIAEAKAAAVAATAPPDRLVIGADTLVVGPDGLMGKPLTPGRAREMLHRLSGAPHTVVTGICVIAPGRAPLTATSSTRVVFRPLAGGEIDAYVSGGEPLDKAGGYAIQGDGAVFVESVDGRVDTVIGLDVALTFELLTRAGFTDPLPVPADRPWARRALPAARSR